MGKLLRMGPEGEEGGLGGGGEAITCRLRVATSKLVLKNIQEKDLWRYAMHSPVKKCATGER